MISWMESGEKKGNARSTHNTVNPWIKINKTLSNQQVKKKLGLFFVGISKIGEEHNKIRLENKEGGSEIVINVAHDTKMMWGRTLVAQSFTI